MIFFVSCVSTSQDDVDWHYSNNYLYYSVFTNSFCACKVTNRVLHNSNFLLSFNQTAFVYKQDVLRIYDLWYIAIHTDQYTGYYSVVPVIVTRTGLR